jgi:hypothetical protein
VEMSECNASVPTIWLRLMGMTSGNQWLIEIDLGSLRAYLFHLIDYII